MNDDMADDSAEFNLRPISEMPEHKRALVEVLLRQARWTDAIAEAEQGDAQLLAELLAGQWEIPPEARQWIAQRADRLAVRRRGIPSKIGDRLLQIERRQYRSWPGRKADYIAYFADAYDLKYENAKRMLEASEVGDTDT